MKIKNILMVFACMVIFPTVARAECIDLKDTRSIGDYASLRELLQTSTSDICFTNAFSVDGNVAIPIDIQNSIKITGLNIVASSGVTSSLLKLSGSNIVLEDAVLGSNGSGTAVQVLGSEVSIKNSTFDHFSKIVDATNGSVNLENNSYYNIAVADILTGFLTSPVIPAFVGKHFEENSTSNVDFVIGKVNLSLDKCSGAVEVFDVPGNASSVYAYKTCSLMLADKDYCLAEAGQEEALRGVQCTEILASANNLKFIRKYDSDHNVGDCMFKCDLNVDSSMSVLIGYSDGAKSSDFVKYTDSATNDVTIVKRLNELPTVISTGLGGIYVPNTPSGGMDGVGGGTENSDPNSKTSIIAGQRTTETGGEINQSAGASGGCGGGQQSIALAHNAPVANYFLSLISLVGLVPILIRRRR